MADIFISYARADRERVRPFAEALEKRGRQVWWDPQIRSGSAFDRIIEKALEGALCVIVIWSHNSVESNWVRAEASDGLERDILVSIAIENELKLPLRFRNVHTDLLLDLAVDRTSSVFNKVVADIEALIGRPKPETAPAKAEAERKTEVSKPKRETLTEPQKGFTNSIGMKFVLIPAGRFEMGSDTGYQNEKPPHDVTIRQSFYLQKTPVTQGQYEKIMGNNPSGFKECGENCPVEWVSWEDAQSFIQKLNDKEGTDTYRLPTEAEWEYACRAGTNKEFSFGDDEKKLGEYAWYTENSGRKTHPVGTKKSNNWGLFDMHGNVLEWVEDDWHSSYENAPTNGRAWIDDPRGTSRVVRGGSWYDDETLCRSAVRFNFLPVIVYPDFHFTGLGFRLAKSFTPGP
jgi:formylglycine-generating enzyme required for sulfatase activity